MKRYGRGTTISKNNNEKRIIREKKKHGDEGERKYMLACREIEESIQLELKIQGNITPVGNIEKPYIHPFHEIISP